MAVALTIGGVTFQYPNNNDELWGREATNWAIAVTNSLNSISVDGDLGPTISAAINNNVTTETNVSGLSVNVNDNRGFVIHYYVYRGRGSPTNIELAEVGTIRGVYKTTAGTWELDNTYTGDTEVEFSVTPTGQIQYTSSDISGTGTYFGQMRYRLYALPV